MSLNLFAIGWWASQNPDGIVFIVFINLVLHIEEFAHHSFRLRTILGKWK